MKSPGGGSKSGGFPTGPSLTRAQKAARDRREAKKDREEAQKAREEAQKAREEAAKAGRRAALEEERAASDRKRGEKRFARQEMAEARANLARQARDLAEADRDEARADRDQARAKRETARARTVGLARPSVPDGWILGGNDRYLTCAAAAVANSLLLATGKRVSDEDVLGLHVAAALDPGAPASVLGVLEAVEQYGLGGIYPESFGPGDRIAELALCGGTHAVLLADGFTVTWGQAVPEVPGQVLAAWQITWR